MADEEGGGNPWGDLIFVLFCMGFLIVFWFVRGRPGAASLGTLFVPSPLDATSTIPTVSGLSGGEPSLGAAPTVPAETSSYASYGIPDAPQLAALPRSQYAGDITIDSYGGAEATDPEQQYIEIYANSTNPAPIDISGWKVESVISGNAGSIGGGAQTPVLGSLMTTGAIALAPGQQAVITTGRSPVGISFEENECSGYLSQFQQFTPSLSLSCPYPSQEISTAGTLQLAQESACVAAVSALAPCQALLSTPTGVSASCSEFMSTHFTYNGCVQAHQNDPNFESGQWRLYLSQSQALWNPQSDIIALLDTQGRLVAAVDY